MKNGYGPPQPGGAGTKRRLRTWDRRVLTDAGVPPAWTINRAFGPGPSVRCGRDARVPKGHADPRTHRSRESGIRESEAGRRIFFVVLSKTSRARDYRLKPGRGESMGVFGPGGNCGPFAGGSRRYTCRALPSARDPARGGRRDRTPAGSAGCAASNGVPEPAARPAEGRIRSPSATAVCAPVVTKRGKKIALDGFEARPRRHFRAKLSRPPSGARTEAMSWTRLTCTRTRSWSMD